MTAETLDVVGIGNAIVDILSHTEEEFLKDNKLAKGAMTLIETEQAEALYGRMGPAVEMSGGSAANTVAAVASLGGTSGFIGKVAKDQLGDVFSHDIKATGVEFSTAPLEDGPPTARSLILITPDAERTMCTFLGASVWIAPSDIEEAVIQNAEVVYLEGYLFDRTRAKQAFRRAAELAHAAGKKVALSLSDPFCVDRHREEFLEMVDEHVDILFANEAEITSLYETEDFNEAKEQVKGHCEIAALTRSEKGSVILSGDNEYTVPAEPVDKLVDTTGAGDLFAAGFLFGYTRGKDLAECARIGSIAAAEVISHIGARPQTKLSKILEAKAAAA